MMTFEECKTVTARDGQQFTVRRLTAADRQGLQAFNRDLSDGSRRLFLPHQYDDDTLAATLKRSEKGRDLILGLFDHDAQVGYFFLWYFDERVPLLGIGLLDAYQGRGLGRQMMDMLVAEARANGNEGVELTTMQDNDRAFALYQKVGFRYLGDVNNTVGDGRVVVERAMFYEIKPGALPMQKAHKAPI